MSAVWLNFQSEKQARLWVTHTLISISTINQLNEAISTAESSQRGYIITGNKDYLDTYYRNKDEILPHSLTKLSNLLADNAVQMKHIEELREHLKARLSIMDMVIRLSEAGSINFAAAEVKYGTGQTHTTEIKAILADMKAHEDRLLESRVAIEEMRAARGLWLVAIILTLLVGTLAFGLYNIRREFYRRLAAEASLEEILRFQKAVLDSSFYTIIVCDTTGAIRLFNPAAEKLLGYSAAEVLGKNVPALFDATENAAVATELAVETGQQVQLGFPVFTVRPLRDGQEEREWTFIHKSGRRISVLASITPLHDNNGQVTGFMGVIQDITERQQIERMKNEFISTVSHELRTPLTSIRGALGLVVGNVAGEYPPEFRRLLDIAYKNTERLVRLINNILDIERIESGRMVFENHPIEAAKVMALALDEMSGLASRKNVRIMSTMPPESAVVMADQDRLLQVLDNLLSNAIKYSPDGGDVWLTAEETADQVIFHVKDNGPGIPEHFWPRLFQKFAQADGSDTRQKEGSGLGLPISKAIIESMQGHISFSSVPGETIFTVSLPHIRKCSSDEVREQKVSANATPILICEDDQDISTLLKIILEREGYSCAIATSATEAKAMLQHGHYAGMTLDLALPDQDGISLIRELRESPKTLNLPIIVVSGTAAQEQQALQGDLLGVLDWIPKPIDPNRLTRAMSAVPRHTGRPRILHIEDDHDLVELIRLSLTDKVQVIDVATLAAARQALREQDFDFAILDIILPDGSGTDLLPELASRDIPVIILSVNETSREIQQQVAASLVKSVVPEAKIIRTIKSLIGLKEGSENV